MKRFLKKSVLFVGAPLLVFFVLQFYSDRGLRRSCSFLYTEWNDIISSNINVAIVVIGSSRAWVHISPAVLDSTFKTSSYNLGIDGYNFLMQYYRFKLLLKYNRKPAYIIQTLECQTLAKRRDLLNYQQFFPYLNETEIKTAIYNYKGMDFKDVYFPMYKYRKDLDVLMLGLKSNFSQESKCENLKYKGFLSSNSQWGTEFDEFKMQNPNGVREKLDTLTIRYFNEYLDQCKKDNIKVILVYPPEFVEAHALILNRDSIINIYQTLSKKYNTPFFDYSNDSISYYKKYFYNSQHLNSAGVAVFNKRLANDLKEYIN